MVKATDFKFDTQLLRDNMDMTPKIFFIKAAHTRYIPGAAAPGYLLMKMTKIVLLTSLATIGLGGHQSKKKSI